MKKLTKYLLSPWMALLTFALLLVVKLSNPYLVDAVRLKFYDYLMLDKPVHSEQIVVANIGEVILLFISLRSLALTIPRYCGSTYT